MYFVSPVRLVILLQRDVQYPFLVSSFNVLELSHSCKTSWTGESQWGSCKKDPAKGQVRNALVSTHPAGGTAAGEDALCFSILMLPWPEGAQIGKGNSASLRLFFGNAKKNIMKYCDLHLEETLEPYSCFSCVGITQGHWEMRPGGL